VAFEVIPAIEVSGGRLVRVTRRGNVPVEAFDGDPLRAARAFVDAGAPRLHLVDVDLAATGRPANLDVLEAVAGLGTPVQASGGATSMEQVAALLGAGAERVVLGSAALADRATAEEILREHGERVVVGIEADGPAIRPRAPGSPELPLWETLGWLTTLDVPRYLFTELGRVGELGGPDLDGIWALATHTERPVVAAGGIRSAQDVRAVAGLGGTVEGVTIGRALYEGLDLAEAIRATA
jgi:phosphoribosylformimino-5-aminoimidazole carboxamide ribonucleotide (ProFAR) isomerase